MCREFRLAGSVSSVSQGFLSAPPPPPRCSSLGGTGPHSLPAFEISVLVRNALALLSLTSPTVRQLMDRVEASAAARARGVQPGGFGRQIRGGEPPPSTGVPCASGSSSSMPSSPAGDTAARRPASHSNPPAAASARGRTTRPGSRSPPVRDRTHEFNLFLPPLLPERQNKTSSIFQEEDVTLIEVPGNRSIDRPTGPGFQPQTITRPQAGHFSLIRSHS